MMSARPDRHSTARQLSMSLDPTKLEGMTQAERNAVIARLANLLMEAAGAAAKESADDRV
jgi:hypothetical protein